ncbi:hypothetical protein R4U18_001622 [Salmonella enterica]|nr:hypothetical protein [Salmonella enterica]HCA3616075.1 hypothetical protein [Salmonella enterica subsp. diarizonae serovar 61:i:z]EEJ1964172.1 hypothetical protein [Salmonella enterica]EHK1061189.1 hypothetical protein [Salmonella enterica]EIB7678461.1 hypothetical protein [Salmonella enterica]
MTIMYDFSPQAVTQQADVLLTQVQAAITERQEYVYLLIRHNWTPGSEGTQGAVAWLLSHPDIRTGLRPCATLHRVFPTDNTLPDGDLRQFLQYQCVSNTMKGVWSDEVTQPHISRLMVALSPRHKAVAEQGEATVIPPAAPVSRCCVNLNAVRSAR